MADNMNMANMLQGLEPTQLMGFLGGLGNMQAIKSPDKMYYCKITQEDGTKCWGFLSPYDDRLAEVTDKVEVDIPTHQALIAGGQIVYFNGELFNSDKYKLNENYDFVLNTDYEQEQAQARKTTFENQFFEVPAITKDITVVDEEGNPTEEKQTITLFTGGWYRKTPKGYSSAVESLNTCFNAVLALNKLPADTLIFYTKPDYANADECTEKWLIAHQFKNKEMTKEQFMQFYSVFMNAWNATEH